MAQSVKRLPFQHEVLSLGPQGPSKNPGLVEHICNPNTKELKTGTPLVATGKLAFVRFRLRKRNPSQ